MTAQKVQKRKKDPYKIFVKITIVIAAIALIGLAVFLVGRTLVDSAYRGILEDIQQQNIADEQAFNMELDAMRENAALAQNTGEEVVAELPSWEATLDDTVWRIQDEGTTGLENTYTVTIANSTLCEGGMMLVNGWHAVPDFFDDANMISIGVTSGYKIPVQDSSVIVFPNAFSALEAMLTDAAAEGKADDIIVREGFRSNETQTELFTTIMDKLSDKYSGTILIEETKKTVNYPGTSEYQSGLSFRLGLYNRDDPAVAKLNFQETEQGMWITENSWKYGIIFRFPSDNFPTPQWEDKSHKTGVSIHLNLYRYVGKPHAIAMKMLGFCMEEYVQFLIDHPHISIYENDVLRYEIVRIKASNQAAYDLPITSLSSEYLASIDNMGGIVMAYTYGF